MLNFLSLCKCWSLSMLTERTLPGVQLPGILFAALQLHDAGPIPR